MYEKVIKRRGFWARLLLVVMLAAYIVPLGYGSREARADYIEQDLASDSNSDADENVASGSNSISTLNLIDDRSFKVSFYNLEEDAQPILIRYVINGNTISETEVPTIPDDFQKFVGWFADGETEPYDFANRPVTDDLNLYATFGDYITVTFREGDKVYKVYTLEEGTVLNDPGLQLEPDGNQIATGTWFVEGDLSSPYVFGNPVTADLTLVPEREHKWIVQFDTLGGTIVEAQYLDAGDTATEPLTPPEREGYDFVQWEENGVPYNFATPVTGNVELTAKYDPKLVDYTVMYMIENENLPLDFKDTAEVDKLENYRPVYSLQMSGLTGTLVTDLDKRIIVIRCRHR